MDHLPHDRPRPDDRHLHHQVVEVVGLHPRQGGHLGPALHLEQAHRVCPLQHRVDLRVVRGQVREIDLDPVPTQRGQAILDRRHHAEAEEIHLDDLEVGAVLLVPLDDHPARHGGRLEGDHLVEPPLGDDHPPRMLAEVARQVLDLLEEPGEERDPPVALVDSRPRQALLEGVVGVHVLEPAHGAGQTVDLLYRDAEHLAYLPGGAAVAVGDDVRGHGGALGPVAFVDVLDHPLAAVAARQVEVDVRPLPALLGEEALEEQLHPHRVHRGDAQAVADRAVGGGAAALDQDPLPAAEVHDVPDDQEVARELELADQEELALDLPPRLLVVGPVALAGPGLRHRAEVGVQGLPRRHRVVGKAIPQVREGELEALRQGKGVPQEVRAVREERLHGLRRFQMPLGVLAQPPSRRGQGLFLADAGQHVEEGPASRGGVANAVRGHGSDAQGVGQVEQGLVRRFLLAPAVPLHVQEDVLRSERLEDAGQAVRVGWSAQRLDPGQGDEPFDAALRPVEGQPALSFRTAGLHARDEPAEALVTRPALHEQRQAASAFEGQLGAHEGPDSRRPRGLEEARGPRDAVPVHERHRRIPELRRPGHEILGQRRGPEEREGRRGMELGVHGGEGRG